MNRRSARNRHRRPRVVLGVDFGNPSVSVSYWTVNRDGTLTLDYVDEAFNYTERR